jgi:hypothetical protein
MTSPSTPAPFVRALAPLIQREWLQHRFGWALMALVPLGLALVVSAVGRVEFGESGVPPMPDRLPLLLAVIPVLAGTALMLVIALVTAFIAMAGLARRDHADRSVEFWLSLPVPHAAALGVPIAVHALLMPAVAMCLGWLGGQLIGVLLVGRVAGLAALAEVPWGPASAATLAILLRLLAGLPLAVLWVLPIVLLLVLLNAWFKRWGWVVLIVGTGLVALLGQLTSGQRWLLEVAGEWALRAGLSLMGAGGGRLTFSKGSEDLATLLELPAMALRDFGAALAALASPLFVGALAFSALCFVLLVRWRQQSAGHAD